MSAEVATPAGVAEAAESAGAATPRLTTRRYGRTGHAYYIDGVKVPGVTTILNAMPKELKQWAADCAANEAIEHWDELAELPLTKRLDRIRYAHRDAVAAAAARGTDIHKVGEALVKGDTVDVAPEILGPAQAYARFLDRWDIEPVATETPCANLRLGYGGTSDLTATIGKRDHARALIDLKSGKNVYAETPLQLTAYRHAEVWQPDGPESEEPQPPVDLVYVAHILPDDVVMIPTTAGERELLQFRYVLQTHHWIERHGYRGYEPLLGEAERP